MFSSITKGFKIAGNIKNIQDTVTTVYGVVSKTEDVLGFVNKQANSNTKLGKIVEQYVPSISAVLGKIKNIIEKYAPILGIVLAQANTNEKVESEEQAKQVLDSALTDLNSLLK